MDNTPTENKAPFHPLAIILTFCAISVLFIYLVYNGNFVFGSKAGGWVFWVKTVVPTIPKWIPLVSLALVGLMVFIGSRLIQKYEKLTLAGCLILATAIQIIISSMVQISLGDIISSLDANSFYHASVSYTPAQVLSEYDTLAPEFPGHAKSNMPGKILFYHFLNLFKLSGQMMGYWIIALSALGGLLLYGISTRLFHDKLVGLYALVLYTLIPCKQEFFPILNTLTPVFILLSLYLFVSFLETKKNWYLILLGVSLYLLAIFEPSPLVTGLLFVGLLIHAVGQKTITFKELGKIILFTVISFAAIYLIFLIAFSFDLIQAFEYVIKDATLFNVVDERPYTIWLSENLKEFFFGAGLPISMISLYLIFTMAGQWKTLTKSLSVWTVEHAYLFSLLVTIALVWLLGVNRGEITRLWIYLAVLIQIPVAYYLVKVVKSNLVFIILAGTLILQTVVTLQRVVFIER